MNFFTPLRFSRQCLNEMTQSKKPTCLERLSGHVDNLLIQSSQGVEIKSLGKDGELSYERFKKVESITSLCLKALLVVLIVPVIIALILKIIVRVYLYLKYSGKTQEIIAPVVPRIEPCIPVPLTRTEILEKFLTLPRLSQEQRSLLITSTELLCSRGCASQEEYANRGILIKDLPKKNSTQPIEFRLTGIPGCSFIHYPGRLHIWDSGDQDIISSSTRTCDVCRTRLDATVNFLMGIPVRNGATQEEVENLIKEESKTNPILGIVGVETFSIHQTMFSLGEHVGVLMEKDFV
ncbi:putative adherence factor [Chlamydia ibidis]|uniref:Putative adherence factor n=1 Tax=Chlamydia ibidis TaxID=1405396 RepID=S7J4G7_9CHLA|nr:putative adherence factor [Chlamydia ibidis]